jgi:hypothetical protein
MFIVGVVVVVVVTVIDAENVLSVLINEWMNG